MLVCLVEGLVSVVEEVDFREVEVRVVVLVQRTVLWSQEPIPEEKNDQIDYKGIKL